MSFLANLEDPYAIKTVFGWGVIGETSNLDHSEHDVSNVVNLYCHPIMTSDITTQNAGSTFVEKTRVKEDITRLFEQDFLERKKDRPVSLEDRKFLDFTKREIHVSNDGH